MSVEIYPSGEYNITAYRGITWQLLITYRDENGQGIDLTGYQAKMQVRVNKYATDVIVELSDGNGITLNSPATGDLSLILTDVQTNAIAAGDYEYDLILTDTAATKLLLVKGAFTVKQPVTQ